MILGFKHSGMIFSLFATGSFDSWSQFLIHYNPQVVAGQSDSQPDNPQAVLMSLISSASLPQFPLVNVVLTAFF